ncbi:DUF4132 domain-containing protein [Akkermansiaceae bacterium]|nr:DUF4132 domain-containing protein [Akkermansiaceae bacterium]
MWSLPQIFREDYLGLVDLQIALEYGLIDDNEVLFSMLGTVHEAGAIIFEHFISVTEKKLDKSYWDHPEYPRLLVLAEKVKYRVVDVELERGDLKQLTSPTVSQIGKVEGISYFMKFAVALGKDNLVRQYQYGEESYAKNSIFSDLLRATHPGPDETVEEFCKLAKESGLPKERFVDLAMFAPHWAAMVEAFIDWPGFEDAVCWVHAHTRDDQRQASEKRCVQIGIENLARTAGYADPVRLEWAMESKAVEDLRSGSVTLEVEDVAITLLIDALGEPQIEVARGGKELKAVPAKLKKKPEVKKFTARKTSLKKQLSRMRLSLEEMMCHREAFAGVELQGLVDHPLLANFLKGLVFSCEGGFGYLAEGGKALSDYDGKLSPVAASDQVMIVHPWDLYEKGDWEKWQHHCFRAELIQPFKQVFRELYPVSEAERSDVGHRSARYAGHQVNPRQAMALLGGRGWLTVPGEGVRKVFHKEKLCAWIDFEEYFYTPGEVEDLTLASVYFYPTDEAKLVPLEKVPSHLFSECIRDLDLVVSVAHSGGVDPEATQSTVEMRRTLAEETCRMMGLKNVTFEKTHALVQGSLAKYSIHLGSTLVQLLPGKAIFLVAVQSQHRGRIFLPFADKDPKTAELLSKVIMLARDERIKDPSILAQLK